MPFPAQSPSPVASAKPVDGANAKVCPRCGAGNPGPMRFCTECGNAFDVAEAPAPAAPAPSGGTTCWRCRGAGDPGAAVCRFCGAVYAQAGEGPAVVPPAAPPVEEPSDTGRPPGVRTMVDAPLDPDRIGARLVAILKDGSDGRAYPLLSDQVDIGRSEGDIQLTDDHYLSPRHARLTRRGDTWYVRDLDSLNGIYVRLREPFDLTDGDMLLIGQQVLKFDVLVDGELPLGPATVGGVFAFGTPETARVARLVQYTTEGVGRDVHYLYRDETVLGRENGDIVFTDDPFLSRRHATISVDRSAKRQVLRDLGSSNGTAVRVRSERKLTAGDQFRIGRHLLRFDQRGATGDRGWGVP